MFITDQQANCARRRPIAWNRILVQPPVNHGEAWTGAWGRTPQLVARERSVAVNSEEGS